MAAMKASDWLKPIEAGHKSETTIRYGVNYRILNPEDRTHVPGHWINIYSPSDTLDGVREAMRKFKRKNQRRNARNNSQFEFRIWRCVESVTYEYYEPKTTNRKGTRHARVS